MKKILITLISLNVFSLELIFNNHILINNDFTLESKKVGGISGMRYDNENNEFLGISDDRSRFAPARFYIIKPEIKDGLLDLKIDSQVFLKDGSNNTFKKNTIDFEDIDILNKDEIIVSDEGTSQGINILPPRVVIFNRKTGSYVKDLLINEKYTPVKDNGHFVSGVRDNLAFEALNLTSDKLNLFFCSEDALIQDGPVATLKENSLVRISQYKNHGAGLTPFKEYAYPLGPIEDLDLSLKAISAQTGIPSILALSANELLVMERTYYPVVDKTKILIFKVVIDDKTTDVSDIKSLKDAKINFLKKEIIFDLDLIIEKLNKDYQFLDNIEAMSFGPILPNGNQTLVFGSDNNFSKYQRTHFIVLEIKK